MDNKGGLVGNQLTTPEVAVPAGEVPGFDEFLKNREDLKPNTELPSLNNEVLSQAAEVGAEQMSSAMPVAAPVDVPDKAEPIAEETPALTELKSINVPRDAERLPKHYVNAITKIINSDKRDPHKLVDDLDEARWDMMEKAFGRKLGDGLNGSGGDAGNDR